MSEFIDLLWRERRVRIEYAWVGQSAAAGESCIVFLHEGLGSVAMWRDFPARLCAATGRRGLVYSRPGYGRSTPRAAGETWHADYLHRQAHEVLPAVLAGVGIDARRDPPWLFGHSDGASIALLYAARFADAVAGAIVLAPHIMVEDVALAGIEKTCTAYREGDLRARLARHHDDPDSAFFGWSDTWLHPTFRAWSIEREIEAIRCPLLAMQGVDDEYATLAQIRDLARHVPRTSLLEIADCRHSPHRDQSELVIGESARFIAAHPFAPRRRTSGGTCGCAAARGAS
ncbi:MAG: alpha/beta fold hydrolase [Burkholderiales bacterium]|nr:alpha/beta fold hydrolase [Burkholderiales bacterium]